MEYKYLFKGVGVALVTLFHDDGSLDAPATADLAGALVDLGVSAVLVAGTTGEASALNAEERTELVSAVRKVVPEGPGAPVIVGTGAATTAEAARYTSLARDAGADAVLALSMRAALDQRPYYDAVAAAAGDLPVLGYHYPQLSPPGIDVDALADLPIAALKDSSGDPARLLQTLDRCGKPLYVGSANLITMAGALGCAGMLLAMANAEPEKCIAAFNGEASAQLRLAKPLRAASEGFPRALKELVAARFGTSTTARLS